MRGDTCHQTSLHETCQKCSKMNSYETFYPRLQRTKSAPAGDRKELCSLVSAETMERPFSLSRGLHMSTCDGRFPSSVRDRAVDADQEKLRKALGKHASLRDMLYGRRLQLREKRNELRQERVSLVDADSNFIKSVRQFPEQYHLEFEHEHYVQLEKQRDLVGSLQYEYDRAEDDFDIAETELSNEEGKLNVLFSKYLNEHGDAGKETTTESSSDIHLQPEEPQHYNEEDEARACLAEYQSRVGDARIMEERLEDLLSEKEERDRFAEKRGKIGVNLGGSDEDFADSFHGRYAGIVDELDIIHADIERLKDGLIQAGHVFPKTNSRPRPLSGSFLQSLQQNFVKTRLQISRWILDTFGSSPIECARHKEILRRWSDESLDDEKWARLVLKYWKQAESDHNNDSWEMVPGDHMESTPQNGVIRSGSPVLLSGRIEANHAMNDFRQQFPPHCTPREHARPYGTEVELDKLSEYESRSV